MTPGLDSKFHGFEVEGCFNRILKNAPKYIYDFDFFEFSFFKCYQIKNGFLQK